MLWEGCSEEAAVREFGRNRGKGGFCGWSLWKIMSFLPCGVAAALSPVTLVAIGELPPGAVLGRLWFPKAVPGPVWGFPDPPSSPGWGPSFHKVSAFSSEKPHLKGQP